MHHYAERVQATRKEHPQALSFLFVYLFAMVIALGCGKVEEIANEERIKGYWIVTESEHSGEVTKFLENESMVLRFSDGTAAFSPVDDALGKGRAVYAILGECRQGPRPYRIDGDKLVFDSKGACPAVSTKLEKLDGSQLKFVDPEDKNITRTFGKIDEEKFKTLVKADDRR